MGFRATERQITCPGYKVYSS